VHSMRLPAASVVVRASMVAAGLTMLQDEEEKWECSVAVADALYAEGKKEREPSEGGQQDARQVKAAGSRAAREQWSASMWAGPGKEECGPDPK
jgi:hypothetical protein